LSVYKHTDAPLITQSGKRPRLAIRSVPDWHGIKTLS